MALYTYTAKNIKSKTIKGKIDANSVEELRSYLRDNNLYLISYTSREVAETYHKFKLNVLTDFCRELGSMTNSGISLIRSMEILVRREKNKKAKTVYQKVYNKLQQGYSFSQALESQGKSFPPMMINMFRSAESTGRIDLAALKLAEQFDKTNKLQNKVVNAMMYPILLLVVTVLVIVGVFSFILPTFFDMFGDMELPLLTKIVFAISKFLVNYWIIALIGVFGIVILIAFIISNETCKKKWHKTLLRIPRVSDLFRIIYTARFARSLSSLYAGGVSMLQALHLAKSNINNLYIEEQFDDVIKNVRNGTILSTALTSLDGFDDKLITSIYIGEESGKLDEMLKNTADNFDYSAELATERLITFIQPIMIIILGGVMVIIMLAILIPLYSYYGSVSAM